MDIPEVRIATEPEHHRVLQTILLAFSSDPLTRWFYPEAATYLDSTPLFDAFGGAATRAGSTYVTKGFEGAALWMPPGVEPDEEKLVALLEASVAQDILDEVMGVFEAMEQYHPDVPCWYLPLIGVDPAHRGKSLGSALMKHALVRCDEDGLPAYLESTNPRNVSLYVRHGFEVMGEIQVGSSPTLRPMIRQPRG